MTELDPTLHQALNERREANIGGRWVPCTIQPRRNAIRSVIDTEEPPSGYRRTRRATARSRLDTYQRTRSGMMQAWRAHLHRNNPHLRERPQ